MEYHIPEEEVMIYALVFKSSVRKDMRRIPNAAVLRIQQALRALQTDPMPQGSISLHADGRFYRIRVGSYRIIYEVAHEIRIVTITRIGHRKNVYVGI